MNDLNEFGSDALRCIADKLFGWIGIMRRDNLIARWGILSVASVMVAGFVPVSADVNFEPSILKVQATETSPGAQTVPTAPSTSSNSTAPERPLTPEEQKAADVRLKFDRALVDAAVLLTDFENYKRGKSKTPISMSAFRNLEIELNAIADADPANDQARDMADKMQIAQFEILQPSVAAAGVASRQLYADRMSSKMSDQGIRVTVSGRGARVVRFVSRQMTREAGGQLLDSAKIAEQARRLQFDRVMFSNGRRSWTYRVESGRYR